MCIVPLFGIMTQAWYRLKPSQLLRCNFLQISSNLPPQAAVCNTAFSN